MGAQRKGKAGQDIARLPTGDLDELFIEYYLHTGIKKEAYVRACKAAGHEYKESYASQYGSTMFKRLQDKISQLSAQNDLDDDVLGRAVQREIANDNDATNNERLTASSYLRKNKPQTVITEKQADIKDIDNKIIKLQKELKE